VTEHPDDEAVRRLLASAGEPSPAMPPDVVARLDDVLAGLVAERDASGDVVPLAPRRARRWPRYLVAAAAVSVLGVGIGSVVQPGGGDSGSSAGSAADSSEGDLEAASPEAGPPGAQAEKDGRVTALDVGSPVLLRSDSLRADAQAAVDRAVEAEEGRLTWSGACVQPAAAAGDQWLAASLDGEPAVLVLRAPESGLRTADVFTCDDPTTPAATTTVQAR
jgi:hypothetical protein